MSVIANAGELMMGSRLKRLGERLFSEVGKVYRDLHIPFEPAWFPVFFLLRQHEGVTTRSLARAMGASDSAASQLIRRLLDEGLVSLSASASDKRQRLVSLTPQGEKLLQQVHPVWEALRGALAEMESGQEELRHLLILVQALENGLNQESLSQRVSRRLQPQLVCLPLSPLLAPLWHKLLKACPDSPLSENHPGSKVWHCQEGTQSRGILAVRGGRSDDHITALLFNRWDPLVFERLLYAWEHPPQRRGLSVTLDAAAGLWAERLQACGFRPERLLAEEASQEQRQLEWRRLPHATPHSP